MPHSVVTVIVLFMDILLIVSRICLWYCYPKLLEEFSKNNLVRQQSRKTPHRTYFYLHDRRPCPHLGHDASSTPRIHSRTVVSFTQQQFWRPIPQRDNTISIPIGLSVLVDTDGSSQTEICQLEDALFGDQNVSGFHVSVDDLVAVDVVEPVEQLLHHLQQFKEILWKTSTEILKYKIWSEYYNLCMDVNFIFFHLKLIPSLFLRVRIWHWSLREVRPNRVRKNQRPDKTLTCVCWTGLPSSDKFRSEILD